MTCEHSENKSISMSNNKSPPSSPFHPLRCIPTEEAINTSIITSACHDSVSADYVYIFLDSYSCNNGIVEQLHDALVSASISDHCKQVLQTYYCNYVYPGCNPNATNEPIGICQENCYDYLFESACGLGFEFLANLGVTSGMFSFPLQCENTARFVLDSGLNVSAVDSDELCNDISGTKLV